MLKADQQFHETTVTDTPHGTATYSDAQPTLCDGEPGRRLDLESVTLSSNEAELPAIQNYQMERVIERGGMGVVYRAKQLVPERPVAIKMMRMGVFSSSQDHERFLNEANAASKLDHPAIVPVYEVGHVRGEPFITMKYIDGTTLENSLRNDDLKTDDVIEMLIIVARAIDHAHSHGIIHRDLKPSNILVDHRNGSPWVTDFGLARSLVVDEQLTAVGDILGTPGYMAPEQAGVLNDPISATTDVYGLGAILYRVITGRPPVDLPLSGLTDPAGLQEHYDIVDPRELNPRVVRPLKDVCLRALETDPARRYQTAGQFADDLERYLNGEPIEARPLTTVRRLHRWSRHHPGLSVTLCAIIVLLMWHAVNLATGLEESDSQYNLAVAIVSGLVVANAWTWQLMLKNTEGTDWPLYAWSTGEAVLLTALLAVGKGVNSPVALIWILLITVSVLRRRAWLVVYVTALAVVGFVGLWQTGAGLHGEPVDPKRVAAHLIVILLVGLTQFIAVRQSVASLEARSKRK